MSSRDCTTQRTVTNMMKNLMTRGLAMALTLTGAQRNEVPKNKFKGSAAYCRLVGECVRVKSSSAYLGTTKNYSCILSGTLKELGKLSRGETNTKHLFIFDTKHHHNPHVTKI